MSELGENLKKLRLNNNLTQQNVADYLEISRVGYHKYENNKTEPSIKNLIRLADLYNVSVDDLIGRTSSNQTPLEKIKIQNETTDQINIAVNKGIEDFFRKNKNELKENIKKHLGLD